MSDLIIKVPELGIVVYMNGDNQNELKENYQVFRVNSDETIQEAINLDEFTLSEKGVLEEAIENALEDYEEGY